jgi:Tol biopolymer transport system component
MAWDGSDETLLSLGVGPLNSTQPSWAPDGRSLLFRANRPPFADTDIWAMGTDGSDQRRLFHIDGQQFYPSWSPDMTRIAFTTPFTPAQQRGVFTVAPDGSDLRTVIDLPGSDESAPNWSPDGRRIAFESDMDGDGEIYLIDPDGTDLVQLTDNAIHDEGPSWSPDGRRIAYTSGPGNLEGDIWVMEADGTGRTRLMDSPGRDESPDWQAVPLGEEMTACGDVAAAGPGASSVHVIGLDCRRALDAAADWSRDALTGDAPAQVRGLFCTDAGTAGAGRLVTCERPGATGTTVRFILRD